MKPYRKIIRWIPRVLCIIAIMFVSMFAFDAFSPESTLWQNLAGFLIHLIPAFVLLAALVVAWKWELAGGILITILGLAATPLIFNMNSARHGTVTETMGLALMVTAPFIISGILFILSHYVNRKPGTAEEQP